MNDNVCVSQALHFILYAEDTTLFTIKEYSTSTGMSNIDGPLDNKLPCVYKWLVINKLSQDISTTKIMVYHPYQKYITGRVPNHFMNGYEIDRVDSFNFLGITLDENIARKPYISAMANKLSK